MLTRSTFVLLLSIVSLAYAGKKDPYNVEFSVHLSPGKSSKFVVEVHPEWAPIGAARFKKLVTAKYFTGNRFFRVIKDYLATFGINGDPSVSMDWANKRIQDDPPHPEGTNKLGYISYARQGPNSRSTVMFVNLDENVHLDEYEFRPFARVIEGLDVVKQVVFWIWRGCPERRGS